MATIVALGDSTTAGTPGWPAYDKETRTTMRFGTESAPVDDPGSAARRLWEGKR